jgi:2,4-dienoyl-CoA reductase-like NADH-dependent reductase (Old Yellow Enzyme family)/thioredoxin reductase
MFKSLFNPIKIGKLEIRNRGVLPSMVTNYCNPDGSVTNRFIAYHEGRAKGGVGLIITEAAYVNQIGKGFTYQFGIDNDQLIPGLKKLVDKVHSHGAKIAIQLYHGGRQANTMVTGESCVAPSAIPCPVMQAIPKELSIEEIKVLVNEFADAAERAQKAGFDAIEIHGAHGYLLNEFLSPNSNQRCDEYGGSVENRRRFPLEVVDAIRRQVGNDFPLIYRISSDEFLPDGLIIEDTAAFSKVLVEHGIDAVNVSGSTYASNRTSSGSDDILGVYVENAAAIKQAVNSAVPVMVANRIKTPQFADDIIANGKADMIVTGRPLLCDADFYSKAENGHADEIRTCLSCNHCISELMAGVPISCAYNPLTGHELEYDLQDPAEIKKKVLVVGGGPGGMEAANTAALKGHSVVLYEQSDHLGGNVLPGTKPPYKTEMMAVIDHLSYMLNKNQVKVKLNSKVDMNIINSEKPDVVIVATGSQPIIPQIPGVESDYVVSAEDVLLEHKTVGNNVVVIGGGMVGVETAEFLADKGKKVSVFEMTDAVLGDMSPVLKPVLLDHVSKTTIKILTGQKVLEIKDHTVITDMQTTDDVDTVVLAIGYKSNIELILQLQEKNINYKVIGDAVKPRRIYQAVKEGFEAAYQL